MVKQTAQTLQVFGTELAETELPNDVSTTNALLAVHTEKKDKMKVNNTQQSKLVCLQGWSKTFLFAFLWNTPYK